MKLQEAVDELAALPVPIEVLQGYPNTFDPDRENRARTCPLARYLTDKMGKPISVGFNFARDKESNEEAKLSPKLANLVYHFDSKIPL